MKIVKFLGGLGNQMFQYSFYLALKKSFKKVAADTTEFNEYTLHNGFELADIFSIQLDTISSLTFNLYNPKNRKWMWRKLRRILGTRKAYIEEKIEFDFDKSIFSDTNDRYYWGYWQHIDYINISANELREDFIFPPAEGKNKELIERIKNKNTVAIHVRRGDYLNIPLLDGICNEAYYQNAISYIEEKVENPLYIIFSNDIPWCKTTFKNLNAIFVDWNRGRESYRDMQLMSYCDHNIIANSSFSWWGAWLNENSAKIVISPKKWINSSSLDQKENGLLMPNFVQL